MSGGKKPRVLIVEDELAQRRIIADILRRADYRVGEAGTVDEALAEIEKEAYDLVLSDWRMPGRDGGELLAELRQIEAAPAFVVMTAYGSINHAVEAIRAGADDYLSKPFARDALLLAVSRVLKTRRLEMENQRLREIPRERNRFGDLIGGSPAMQRLYRTIEKVAPTEATVLISGESGTGKELAARMLHRSSTRAGQPFVAVNCAAIPETLIESELFGHEKGSFTGAHRRRRGRFEEAEGGTLFLDEIASMPLPLQATLLRVLQDGRITRLGGSGEIACDVRVVAASNRDLREMAREGLFREDLYYRLNVVPINLPPLRERMEDVPHLAEAFLRNATERHGRHLDPLPPKVLSRLMQHHWPGNVRELANTVERLVLLAEGPVVSTEDLPPELGAASRGKLEPLTLPPEGINWMEMERSLITQALEMASGNRTRAAKLLGLGYKAFLYRLEKHGLAENEPA